MDIKERFKSFFSFCIKAKPIDIEIKQIDRKLLELQERARPLVEQLWDLCENPDLDNIIKHDLFALWCNSEQGGHSNLGRDDGPDSYRNNSIKYYRSKMPEGQEPDNFHYEFIFKGMCWYPVKGKESYIEAFIDHCFKTEEDILELEKVLFQIL